MKRILKLGFVAVVALFAFGCAQNAYNVTRESYEQKVKILGVAPIFVDADSDIKHPDKDALLALVKEFNRKNEKELLAMLKDTGSYFSVRPIETADPDQLFKTVLYRSEKRDDAGVPYNKQFFKAEELKTLVTQNGVDAVMITVVSGLTRRDKVFSSNILKYLETDYNYLIMTSQILDANGVTLWEYPNFRKGTPSTPVLVELQYPDFDQAEANMDDKVEVKFKTIPGISRYLGKKEKDLLFRERRATAPYYHLFDDMVSLLKRPPFLFGEEKSTPAARPEVKPAPAPQASPTVIPEAKPEIKPEAQPQPATNGEAIPKPSTIKEETIK